MKVKFYNYDERKSGRGMPLNIASSMEPSTAQSVDLAVVMCSPPTLSSTISSICASISYSSMRMGLRMTRSTTHVDEGVAVLKHLDALSQIQLAFAERPLKL